MIGWMQDSMAMKILPVIFFFTSYIIKFFVALISYKTTDNITTDEAETFDDHA